MLNALFCVRRIWYSGRMRSLLTRSHNNTDLVAFRSALLNVLVGGLALGGCQYLNFGRGETAPEKPPACLGEMKDLREQKFGLEGSLEDRVHATFGGVLHLEETATKLDDRLADVCEGMARSLGVDKPRSKLRPPWVSAPNLPAKKP